MPANSYRGGMLARTVLGLLWKLTFSFLLGCLVILVVGFFLYLGNMPDLSPWHKVHLKEEFTVDSGVTDFQGYLELEDRLFRELDQKIYKKSPAAIDGSIKRYHRGSLSDPARWPRNWNRSFQLGDNNPAFGVLLLHGLSDSPYYIRSIAQSLSNNGGLAIGLRIPGHGTIPSGLVKVHWEDMAAAVDLAMAHLKHQLGDKPIYLVGFSNGGALAIHQALKSLEDKSLPRSDGIVQLSAEVAITKLAALAKWQTELGFILGQHKLYWKSVRLEYDPFKYNSFAANAAEQAHRLTLENQRMLTRLEEEDALAAMPPLLVFQSVVDATVIASALVDQLLQRLPNPDNALVLFDINRYQGMTPLLNFKPMEAITKLLQGRKNSFELNLITNATANSELVELKTLAPGSSEIVTRQLCASWPEDIYSMSHVNLPIHPQDPLYGGKDSLPSPGIQLGNLALRGEYGVLKIADSDMLRLRWNPFFAYMQERIVEFMSPGAVTKKACNIAN